MRHRVKRFRIVRIVCVIAISFIFITIGESGAVELSDLAADFGRTDCGSPIFCEGDMDGDGDVDGKDIASVVLASQPEISFATTSTAVSEGDTVLVELDFSGSYSGQVTLEVSGPAYEGNDHGLSCLGQECSATVNDSQGTLQVPITEDTEIEEMEWLEIRIVPGDGYQVGALGEHVITIEDNDAVWEGLFTSKGEELGFSIEILRSGETVTAKLLAEGGGIIPSGAGSLDPQELQFPLTFNLVSKIFSATLPEVPLPQEDTLLGTNAAMWLELEATESSGSVSSDRVKGLNDLGSTSRMRIQFSGQSHLDSNVPGSFVLQRRPAKPSTREVTLEDIY